MEAHQMISDTVYLDGRFLPLAEARISPLDRGFLFGDGVYEVIPVYSRRPFRLSEHLNRLTLSLRGIQLADPNTVEEWQRIIKTLVAEAPWEDQGVYLQITRGADLKRDLPFPEQVIPTVFGMSMPLLTPSLETRQQGVAAITTHDNRWARCDLKSTSLLANVLHRQQSADVDAAETILLRDGYLTEGSASSILVVCQDTLLAPPESNLILPGVTCNVALEMATQNNVPVAVRPITEAELRSAEEIWLTSSTKEILAVTRLDGKLVGKGRPGPRWQQMWGWYQEFKNRVMRHGG